MFFKRVWVTGDTHGNFEWLKSWCESHNTSKNTDLLIICGDAGLMYYGQGKWREENMKKFVQEECPITLLCVRGNHEARPANYKNIQFVTLEDDPVVPSGYYFEPNYPDIWYAADGSTFNINNKRCLFIGGAYSVDKEYRQLMGWRWFADEELTSEECCDILDKIDHKRFDFVFTHTCPEDWQPYDLFMSCVDQSKVSKKMEQFLTTVSEIIDFDHWYFGHFHAHRPDIAIDRTHPGQGQVSMLFDQVEQLCDSEGKLAWLVNANGEEIK